MATHPSLVAEALVREYLTRHGMTAVLEAFNEQRPRGPDAIGSKAELAKALGIERPIKKNKDKGDAALKSCLEVLSEYLAAKAAAVSDKAGDKGSDKTGATASASAKHATAPPPNSAPASPPCRETAPAAPAPVTRPTTAPSLAQGVKEDAKAIWSEERPPARGPPPYAAAANDLLVADLEELDTDDDLGQAFMLRHLLFMDPSLASCRPPAPCSRKVFEEALFNGLADILWQAGNGRQAVVAVFSGKRRLSGSEEEAMRKALCRSDDFTEMLSLLVLATLQKYGAEFTKAEGHGVAMVLYSAILSRGIPQVNLLLVGRAVGNVFDGDKDLDGVTLKGILTQGEVGFLTLFEHYGSMEVGQLLKRPKVPIWVVCSESHFSVCFSVGTVPEGGGRHELYYYDGLCKQEAPILLSVSWVLGAAKLQPQDFHKDMTPPLEHCIRTRWPAASVDWNGTDPIL